MTKKTGMKRRMKKQVRKTLGALFMAAAVGVALIPTRSITGGEVQAANTCNGTGLNAYYLLQKAADGTPSEMTPVSNIPFVKDSYNGVDTQIYSTGDGSFQFAYVNDQGEDVPGGTNKFAVILGFNSGYIAGGTLEIPNTFDVYRRLNDNKGNGDNCLVGKSGNFLYYIYPEETHPTVTVNYQVGVPAADLEPFANEKSRSYMNNYFVYEKSDTNELYQLLNAYDGDYNYLTKTPDVIRVRLDSTVENKNVEDPTITESYTYTYTIEHFFYKPCLYSEKSNWINLSAEEFYWYDTDSSITDDALRWKLTSDAKYQKVENIEVRYIGNQYVYFDSGVQDYKLSTGRVDDANPESGVFAGSKGSNITTLITHENLAGVGDYAFYNCVSLSSIEFQNGLIAIGNHAFDGCRGLSSVKMPTDPKLQNIGAYAFKNCKNLTGLYIPHSVNLLCDGVFYGCEALRYSDLTGDMSNVYGVKEAATVANIGSGSALANIGYHVFYGCSNLEEVIFPKQLGEMTGVSVSNPRKININIFEDCPNLAKIAVLSPTMVFADDTNNRNGSGHCDFTLGKSTDASTLVSFTTQLTNPEFYFEGVDPAGSVRPSTNIGALHQLCQNRDKGYEFTYKYFGDETYERTVIEDGGGKAIYAVDNTNSLVGFDTDGVVKSLTFPEHLGPYHIEKIPDEKCRDICTLEKVELPATINEIGRAAFKGCHNLSLVIFGNDKVVIGDEAFKTQDTTLHKSNCPQGLTSSACPDNKGGAPAVTLYFVTTVSADSTPFAYAMSDRGKYNHPMQNESWPVVLSGFPNLLEVSYNPNKDCAELVKFPTLGSLANYAAASNKYLSQDEKDAISHFLEEINTNHKTLDELEVSGTTYDKQLVAVCKELFIPTGVESIEDGLFNSITSSNPLAVNTTGLTEIDVEFLKDTSGNYILDAYGNRQVDPDKSDFAGCDTLTALTLSGSDTITIPDYAFNNCTNMTYVYSTQPVEKIGELAFAECRNLGNVEMYGVKAIGDHAFYNDDKLTGVKFDSSVNSLGVAPFRVDLYDRTTNARTSHTSSLTNVDFQDNTRFKTDNGIIFSLDATGNKQALIEYLPGRNAGTLQPGETKGVSAVSQEAFADTGVNVVNMENATFYTLPEKAFEDTIDLVSVTLPQSCNLIDNYAFKGSNLKNLTVMSDELDWKSNGLDLVRTTMTDPTNDATDHGVSEAANDKLTVYAPAEKDADGNVTNMSKAYERFKNHNYLVQAYTPIKHYYVTYYDYVDSNATKATLMYTDEYVEGDQVILRDPNMDADNKHSTAGFAFECYYNLYDTEETYDYRYSFNITSDLTIVAKYKGLNNSYTAVFYDTDPESGATGAVLMDNVPVLTVDDNGTTKYYINANQIAYLAPPAKNGYTFQTWTRIDPRDGVYFTLDQVEEKDGIIKFYAKYSSGNGGDGGNGGGVVGPGQYKVTYYLPDGSLYQTWGVDPGGKAYDIVVPGYSRTEWQWSPSVSETVINSDTKFVLVPIDGTDPTSSDKYTATYYYTDGVTVYQTLTIEKGGTPPDLMMPAGYKQCKWSPDPSSITMDKNMRFTMVNNPDYTGTDDGYTGPYYTLTVVNGSGSGSYKPGAQVVIVANEAKTGTVFSSWTISPATTPIASKAMSATVVTMPSANVTVTANFVTSTSGNNNNGAGGTGSGGNGNTNYWPSTGNVVRSSGTTVVVDKNGLSNTGVVSATVNGSSDNFTIKVTASQTADKAVLDALLKKYGSLDNIIYFPMDISLYDAAGTTQIHDTSGLTITITLPLPDSMIQYGANNKVAVVTNNELDGLNAKFTTINGVPCVTFTCTHFSPYVIYVNTVEMTAGSNGSTGGGLDDTPKTADFIHPKWFLSIALFAISLVLFLIKDKRTNLKPVKANNNTGRTIRK